MSLTQALHIFVPSDPVFRFLKTGASDFSCRTSDSQCPYPATPNHYNLNSPNNRQTWRPRSHLAPSPSSPLWHPRPWPRGAEVENWGSENILLVTLMGNQGARKRKEPLQWWRRRRSWKRRDKHHRERRKKRGKEKSWQWEDGDSSQQKVEAQEKRREHKSFLRILEAKFEMGRSWAKDTNNSDAIFSQVYTCCKYTQHCISTLSSSCQLLHYTSFCY